jgi:tetratricopeptide (TPR) repeat protein
MPEKNSLTAIAACLVLLLSGCGKKPGATVSQGFNPGTKTQPDHLEMALDYVSRLDEFDPEKGMLQTAYYLNRWIADLTDETEWKADPLIERLPNTLRRIPPLTALDRSQFTLDDVRFLREAFWMRSISQWVSRETADLGSKAWLRQVEKSKGEQHAYELGLALRLFDWTVRNIQLEALLPYPSAAAGPAAADQRGAPTPKTPPEQALPGPGYTAFPWQTLLLGRGDAWQRARVFLLLARQQHLDVVMLALDAPQSTPRPRPWLPAVVIDDQLYLFDAALGLPVPGPDGEGIATLQQVRGNPELLRSLDVGEKLPYPVGSQDLQQVVALIDAAPEFLSRRMQRVAAQRNSAQPLVVSVEPAEIAARVRKCAGVDSVTLWAIPGETWVFRTALERRAEKDPAVRRQKLMREWLCEESHSLGQARRLHFRGRFEVEDGRPGAKALYLQSRLPNAAIAEIEKSPEVQQALGIVRTRENEQEWRAMLRGQTMVAQQVKQAASYWLGLVHYETGRYDVAVDWLKTRTLEAGEGNAWASGARYNLARCYEALGNIKQARELLLLDDSAQQHGSLLLAQRLRQRLEQTEPATEKPTDEPPATK